MNYWLETETGETFPLQGACSVGRLPENTLVIDDNQISRRHALLHAQGGAGYWLVDLGSRNGTILNGQRVRMPMQLQDGDRIQMSSAVLVFRASEPSNDGTEEALRTVPSQQTGKSCLCWLLVTDIVQFTKLSQSIGGDELAQHVGKWVLACKTLVEKNRGCVNKFLGDGFLAFWPPEIIQPDAMANTIRDLKDLQSNQTMKFRIVVHYGEVRIDSSLSSGEENLIGPQVNFVFRMEKLCGALEQSCLLSEPAANQLRPQFELTPQGQHCLPGFDGTYSVFSC